MLLGTSCRNRLQVLSQEELGQFTGLSQCSPVPNTFETGIICSQPEGAVAQSPQD